MAQTSPLNSLATNSTPAERDSETSVPVRPLDTIPLGGHIIGNGGRGVACQAEYGATFTLLEIVEAKEVNPEYNVALGSPQLSLDAKIDFALDRLAKVSPDRAAIYRKRAALIKSSVRMAPLIDVQDSEHVTLEPGCELHQAALQREAPLAGKPREYYFDTNWYPKLDLNSQAALFLHEIVYTEELDTNHVENSLTTRAFVSALISDKFEKLTTRQLESLFTGASLDGIYVQGALLSYLDFGGSPARFDYYQNGVVKNAFVITGSTVSALGKRIQISGRLQFYSSGRIEAFNLLYSMPIVVRAGNVPAVSKIGLNPNGSVKSFTVGNYLFTLRDAHGTAHQVSSGDMIELDSQGYWLRTSN